MSKEDAKDETLVETLRVINDNLANIGETLETIAGLLLATALATIIGIILFVLYLTGILHI